MESWLRESTLESGFLIPLEGHAFQYFKTSGFP
jgi:hypothetical protein